MKRLLLAGGAALLLAGPALAAPEAARPQTPAEYLASLSKDAEDEVAHVAFVGPQITLADEQALQASGELTAEDAVLGRLTVQHYFGDRTNAVLAFNPDALKIARALDAERKAGKTRGPLHGLPILIKDNIDSADGLPTTAGSLPLKDNVTNRDAPLESPSSDPPGRRRGCWPWATASSRPPRLG